VLNAEGVGPLRRAPTFPPPPPMGHSGPPPGLERERSPYVSKPQRRDSRVIDSDDDNEPLSIPIERERKPYAAAPGGGKLYEDLGRSMQSDSSNPEHRQRTQSTTSQSQYPPPPVASQPAQHHPRTASNVNGRRPRSPSFSSYGNRSDPNVRDVPGSYYSSNVYDSEEENRRFAKDAEMKRNDWARRQAEEDSASNGYTRRTATGLSDSSYESQPRSYDDDQYRGRSGTNGYDNRGYEHRRY
jgi:hypothetical protein